MISPGLPLSRALVAPINRLAGGLRKAGGQVIWINHANVATASGSDWSGFFDRFVAADVRQRTIESLAPGREGQQVWAGLDVHAQDLHIIKNRYSALIPGSSSLERVLRSLGLETVLIAGTKTNVCCESTAGPVPRLRPHRGDVRGNQGGRAHDFGHGFD